MKGKWRRAGWAVCLKVGKFCSIALNEQFLIVYCTLQNLFILSTRLKSVMLEGEMKEKYKACRSTECFLGSLTEITRLNYIMLAKLSFVSKRQLLVQFKSVSASGKEDNKREYTEFCSVNYMKTSIDFFNCQLKSWPRFSKQFSHRRVFYQGLKFCSRECSFKSSYSCYCLYFSVKAQ